jgi:hypothetical protein
MEARAHAGNGEDRACSRALSEAERYFEKSDSADDPQWISYFDAAELAGEGAHCFRDLRSPKTTHEFVTRAIELTDPVYVRTLAFVRLVHAASYVQQREPSQAVEVARGAIELAGSLKSHRYLRYIRDLRTDLAPYEGESEVREFSEFVCRPVSEPRRWWLEGLPVAGSVVVAQRGEAGAEFGGDLVAHADVLHQPGGHFQLVDRPDHREAVPSGDIEAVCLAEIGEGGVGVPADEVLGRGDARSDSGGPNANCSKSISSTLPSGRWIRLL